MLTGTGHPGNEHLYICGDNFVEVAVKLTGSYYTQIRIAIEEPDGVDNQPGIPRVGGW
jgi:hypothetical protein